MKVGVIGLGSAGSRHARLLLELGHDVVGFDPGVSAPSGVAQLNSFAEAVAESDAVVIASPNTLHAEQALGALEAGAPVLVEKPLATTTADAERVVEAAKRAGVACGVGMNLRFHPALVELRQLVDNGALGPLRFAQASFGYDLRLWHPNEDYRRGYSARADLGGGIVLDAIHELDYVLWLLGPVISVTAETAHVSDLDVDVEDVAVVAMRFRSGALGAIDLNFIEPAYRRGCLLVGTRATARWDWRRETVTISRVGEEDRVSEVRCDVADTYRAELADFLAAAESGETPRTTAREGMEAVRAAEAVKESALLGRRIELCAP